MAEVKTWLAVGIEKKKEREKQYHGSSMDRI